MKKTLLFLTLVTAALAQVSIDWGDVDKTGSSLAHLAARNFSDLQGKPTTAAGYGLTDVITTAGGQTIGGNLTLTGALNVTGTNTTAANFTRTGSSASISAAFVNTAGTTYLGRRPSGIFAVATSSDLSASPVFSIDLSGNVSVPVTTASTSATTGALTVGGGAGFAGAVFTGDNVRIRRTGYTGESVFTVVNSGGSADSAFGMSGGSPTGWKGASQAFIEGWNGIRIGTNDTTANKYFSVSSTAVEVAAGLPLLVSNTSAATSTSTGALRVSGGASVTGLIYGGGGITSASSGSGSTAGLITLANTASVATGNAVQLFFTTYSSAPNSWSIQAYQNSTTPADQTLRFALGGVAQVLHLTGSGATVFGGLQATTLQASTTGTPVDGIWSATATLDFGSISAGAQADLTITVTGASVGDSVSLGLPAAPAAGIVFDAFVSATNTVTVRASNITGSPVDPASATYRATVTSF